MTPTESVFPSIPFEEAIAALKRRGIHFVPSEHWASVWQECHQTGFTVARSSGFDILGDIHSALVRVQEEGRTYRDFARDLTPVLQKKGWWGKKTTIDPETGEARIVQLGSPRRLRTIYDVNLRVSQAQGKWERQWAMRGSRPYLRYVGILDSKIRPQHRIWHGRILPIDHPWWKTHYPPNGWRCRCDTMELSEDDLQRFGWEVSSDPADDGVVPWINPATGELLDVPRGIDPGWAYNPGNVDQAAHAAKVAMDKLIALPPEIGAEAVTELAFAFPQVERELAAWIENIARDVLESEKWHPRNERRVVGCIDRETLLWLASNVSVKPETASITIADGDIMHLVRTSKRERGNSLTLEEVKLLPGLLMRPDAVYWDKGFTEGESEQTREPGLLYAWKTDPGKAGKLIVRIDFKDKYRSPEGKRTSITTNTVRSGRTGITPDMDLQESKGYFKIKGNL